MLLVLSLVYKVGVVLGLMIEWVLRIMYFGIILVVVGFLDILIGVSVRNWLFLFFIIDSFLLLFNL